MGVQIAFDFLSEPPVPAATGGPAEPGVEARMPRLRLATSEASSPRYSRNSLEAHLRTLTGLSLSLRLTDNERTMISTRRQGDELTVRLHHMFLEADRETLRRLAGYLDKSDGEAGEYLGRFIARHRDRIHRRAARRIHIRTRGQHHDLAAIFARLNREYFDNAVEARVTWGRHTSVKRRSGAAAGDSRRSIKLGSYRSGDALIRIHPVLDAAWVPEVFVAYIVYHEMLHQVLPPRTAGNRRAFHGPEFRQQEQRFAGYAEALAWEQRNLRRLLRA